MALRGFSCSNCHTWFEGEGNHPRCPLCGTRASPSDLLDDREHREAGAEQPTTYWEFEAPPTPSPADYELPTRTAPDDQVSPEQVPDYETPRQVAGPRSQEETIPDYESPAGAPERVEEKQGTGWSERIGPAIGVLIFVAVILSNVCDALSNSD